MNQPQPTEEQHRAEERKHWAKLESRASWLNIITGVGAIVGLGGLFILYGTLKEAKIAAVDANRAWISPGQPYFNLDGIDVGQPVKVAFPFSNHGREPAIDVTVIVHFDTIAFPQNHDVSDTEKISDNICELGIKPVIGSTVTSSGQIMTETVTTNVRGSNVVWDDALNTSHNILRAKVCVFYETFGVRRYTWFCRLFQLQHTSERDHQQSRRGVGAVCNGGDGAT
jgi:hypothetical protein